jgi:arabinosaccharide transport system permease protein
MAASATQVDPSEPQLAQSKASFWQRPAVVAAIFMAPFLILYLVFRVYAIGQAVALSFQDIEGVGVSQWTGLSNYRELLSDRTFFLALRNTTLYTAGTLLILIPLPFVLAAVLHSNVVRRANAFRTVFFLPILASLVVVGVVFSLLLTPEGLVNEALGVVGLPGLRWLETRVLAVPSLILLATWRWTGINIIYFTTGLSNIPDDLYEAAAIDGASGWRKFWHLSVPLSRPIILFVVVLSLFGGFQMFVEPFVLFPGSGTGGGPGQGALTIVIYLYRTAFQSFRLGYAAAIGVALALIIMVASLIQLRVFGFFERD